MFCSLTACLSKLDYLCGGVLIKQVKKQFLIKKIFMIQTTDIMHNVSRLPVSQRMLIAEYIIRSIRLQEQQSLEKAAECMYEDYINDKELTVFTQLDCEDFYVPYRQPVY